MHKKSRIIFIILALIVAGILIFFVDINTLFDKEALTTFLESRPLLAPLIFMLLYIVATILFLPASILTIVSGIVFGTLLGSLYTIIGAMIGAVLAFLIGRYVLHDFVEEKLIKKFRVLRRYSNEIERNGFQITLLLRLIPIVPFIALNYFLGLTKINLSRYTLASLIGIIPGTVIYAFLGGSLASLNIWQIVAAIIVLLLFSYVVTLLGRLFKKHAENEYDIVVIGAGSGGLNIAGFMNKAGFKTLLINRDDQSIGGDCLNTGCVPSKAIIHAAKITHHAKEAQAFGLDISGTVNLETVRQYVSSKVEHIREHENAEYLKKQGMDVALGYATFSGLNEVTVENKKYTASKIVLATGSSPRIPNNLEGLNKITYHTNETIFNLNELPKKLVVVGGGPIGSELAQTFARLGSEVTIVNKGDHILEREEVSMGRILEDRFESEGITLHHHSEITRVIDANTIEVTHGDGSKSTLACDTLLFAIGRVINISGLNPEKADIDVNDRGVPITDKYLRTTNKHVYVCGDALGQHQFTHAAELHASLIIKNFFAPIRKKVNTDSMAWVTYTDPEVATFGISKKDLEKRGIRFRVLEQSFAHDDRAIVDSYTYGLSRLYAGRDGTLLGGTMIAPNAGELIQELILVQNNKMKLGTLFSKVYPYPTATRVNKLTISKYFAEKLTPCVKKILKMLYR